jgi:hypothetical protein
MRIPKVIARKLVPLKVSYKRILSKFEGNY